MRSRAWAIADPHFLHPGVCKFLRADGTKLRPWNDELEMTNNMISYWNELVKPEDKVYMAGDIAFKRAHLWPLQCLNGRKVLIKGNHDILDMKDYAKYFYDIRGCHIINKMIMTHIPIHPGSMNRFRANIHGHLHYQEVLDHNGHIDYRYACISVEHTNYRPILLDEVFARVEERLKLI